MAKYILCVDDDKSILLTLRAQLKHHFGQDFGYELAESAKEAWEVIEELSDEGEELVAIISDWLMPEIKGDEFLIDVHKSHPEVIKVMLTGHADEAALKRAKENANLYACLTKPWDKEELVELIATAMEG